MTDWTSEYMTLIEDCKNRSTHLTDWELKFIDSIENWIADGRRPTPKQIDTLDSIWEKATKRG